VEVAHGLTIPPFSGVIKVHWGNGHKSSAVSSINDLHWPELTVPRDPKEKRERKREKSLISPFSVLLSCLLQHDRSVTVNDVD
jgi:hypothetical protein